MLGAARRSVILRFPIDHSMSGTSMSARLQDFKTRFSNLLGARNAVRGACGLITRPRPRGPITTDPSLTP